MSLFEEIKKMELRLIMILLPYGKIMFQKIELLNAEKKIISGRWEVRSVWSCSEIHIDLRNETEKSKVDGLQLVNQDHPQVIEIWNLVFMEFNRNASGILEQLNTNMLIQVWDLSDFVVFSKIKIAIMIRTYLLP